MNIGIKTSHRGGTLGCWHVVVITALMMLYPPVYIWLSAGFNGIVGFFPGDSYLYMGLARRSVAKPFFTWDGQVATNGFHPLWEYVLSLFYWLGGHGDRHALLITSFWLSVTAGTAGACLTSAAIYKYTRSTLLSTLVVPGVYYILIGVLYRNQMTWSNIDGMESGLSMFFGGILFYIFAANLLPGDNGEIDPPATVRRVAWQVGLVLPWTVLARLDDVFLVPGFIVVVWFLLPTVKQRVLSAIALGAPTTAALACYLLYNKITTSMAMPVSGATKAGLAVGPNSYIILSALFPPLIDLKNAISSRQSHGDVLFLNNFRAVQLFYPVILCFFYVAVVRRFYAKRAAFLLPLGLVILICVKAGYNLVFVNFWHQGTWYFALPMLSATFLVAIMLGGACARLDPYPLARRLIVLTYALFFAAASGHFIQSVLYGVPAKITAFWRDAPQIQKALDAAGVGGGLIEFDDGITGFLLDSSTIHGFGFAIDKQGAQALRDHRLLQMAYDRGHEVLTGFSYLPISASTTTSDDLREALRKNGALNLIESELDAFDFQVIYRHPATELTFIRFKPKAAAGAAAPSPG
jgi:hypothetical protein